MPFKLELIADVSRLIAGTRDVEQSLEDMSDALDGLDDESSDASRALQDDLEKIGREADDAADKTEKSFKDALDTVKRDAGDAGRAVGRDLDEGFDKASEGADEFKDEAAQSAREGAASFTGEWEDVADYVQEVLANSLAGFGPLGTAAGIAAAAGIGILISSLEDSAEEAEETKSRIIDLADQIREVDGDLSRLDTTSIFLDWANRIVDTKEAFEIWQDAPITQIERMSVAADTLGVSLADVVAALRDAGGPEAGRLGDLIDQRLNSAFDASVQITGDQVVALEALRTELQNGSLDLSQATELYNLQNEALGENAAALDYAREATDTYNESVQDALAEAGDAWTEYTENGKVDLEAYADAMEDQIKAVEEYQQNMKTASETLSDEALAYLQNMGVEAAPLLAAFVNAPLDEQQRLAGIWSQLGQSAVDGYGDRISGLTDETNAAIARATAAADPVRITYASEGLQKTVNNDLARVLTPIVRVRYSSVNPVGNPLRRV